MGLKRLRDRLLLNHYVNYLKKELEIEQKSLKDFFRARKKFYNPRNFPRILSVFQELQEQTLVVNLAPVPHGNHSAFLRDLSRQDGLFACADKMLAENVC